MWYPLGCVPLAVVCCCLEGSLGHRSISFLPGGSLGGGRWEDWCCQAPSLSVPCPGLLFERFCVWFRLFSSTSRLCMHVRSACHDRPDAVYIYMYWALRRAVDPCGSKSRSDISTRRFEAVAWIGSSSLIRSCCMFAAGPIRPAHRAGAPVGVLESPWRVGFDACFAATKKR